MEKITSNFEAMGTSVGVEIISQNDAQEAAVGVEKIFRANEKIFSRFSSDSELAFLNKNLGRETAVSPKMAEVLELCLKFHRISEGYFDPRVFDDLLKIGYDINFRDLRGRNLKKKPHLKKYDSPLEEDLFLDRGAGTVLLKRRIDTTGIVKGFTVDEAARHLTEGGFENFIVDAGGDMFARGSNEEGEDWLIGVEGADPRSLMLKLRGEGMATSGITRKNWLVGGKKVHHLINPKDPENFSHSIRTVTVIADKTVEADGRAKTLVLMGKEKGLEFAERHGLKALFLDEEGEIFSSRAMTSNILR